VRERFRILPKKQPLLSQPFDSSSIGVGNPTSGDGLDAPRCYHRKQLSRGNTSSSSFHQGGKSEERSLGRRVSPGTDACVRQNPKRETRPPWGGVEVSFSQSIGNMVERHRVASVRSGSTNDHELHDRMLDSVTREGSLPTCKGACQGSSLVFLGKGGERLQN